jgi:hypothetical protein
LTAFGNSYLVVEVEGKTQKTKSHIGGGQHPQWNADMQFEVEHATTINVTVKDEDAYDEEMITNG